MLSKLAEDLFETAYKGSISKDQYTSYLERGMLILEHEGVSKDGDLEKLRAMRIALEYRQATLLQLLQEQKRGA
jgi:hypothetical protein